MRTFIWLLGLLVLLALGAGGFIWSGVYNVAADDPHWPLTNWMMVTVRERSFAARTTGIDVPDLTGEALIRAGAGNYDAMCADCHLEPGEDGSELSVGLYPAPPNFPRDGVGNPAETFWVIKHGIKMSGMPAWGKSMDDKAIWGMTAFLQQLPQMSKDQYHELVESSGGHSHGPSEAHDHADDEHHDHDD